MPDTVPVFAPDGSLGDIPSEKLPAAIRAGFKPGVNMISADGSRGVVPADRYVDAVKKGGMRVAPFAEQDIQHPGFWVTLKEDLSNIVSSVPSLLQTFNSDPNAIAQRTQQASAQLKQMAESDAARAAAGRGLPYRAGAQVAQLTGTNVTGMEQSAAEGDVGGVLGHATAVPAAMAATYGAAKALPPTVAGLRTAARASRPIAASAASIGADVLDNSIAGAINPRLPHAGRLLARLADVLEVPPEQFTNPGGPFPAMPAPELLQAGALQRGAQVVMDPSAGLGQTPVAPAPPITVRRVPGEIAPEAIYPRAYAQPAQPIPPRQGLLLHGQKEVPTVPEGLPPVKVMPKPAAVQASVERALGNEPVQIKPGVPIKNQIPPKVPEGFTPVESSALSSYKYDPATREFQAHTTSGKVTYVYGDVSPEDAAAFASAESKGQAFQQIKQNPLVAKIIDGKRIPVKPLIRSGEPMQSLADLLGVGSKD